MFLLDVGAAYAQWGNRTRAIQKYLMIIIHHVKAILWKANIFYTIFFTSVL